MYFKQNYIYHDQNSQNSRQAPQPVDHLTGHMMVKCLDRIQALTDERELIQTKLQVRNMTL